MEIIRDPIWNNIRVDALALELVDTPVFQRLRYVRQLGHTYLVYPGATHTRSRRSARRITRKSPLHS
jgi:HD superfamily phosphohydrolase